MKQKNRSDGYTLRIHNLNITLCVTVYLSRTETDDRLNFDKHIPTLLRNATNQINGIARTQDYLRAQEKLGNAQHFNDRHKPESKTTACGCLTK